MVGKRFAKRTESSNLAPSKCKRKIHCPGARRSFHRKSNSSTALNFIYNTKSCRRSRCSSQDSLDSIKSIELESREESKTTGSVFCGITPSDQNLVILGKPPETNIALDFTLTQQIFALSNSSTEDLLPSQHSSREFETPLDKFSRRFRAREEEEEQVHEIFPKNLDATGIDDGADLKPETLLTAIRQIVQNSAIGKNDDLLTGNQNVTESDVQICNLSKDASFAEVVNQLLVVKDDLVKAQKKNRKLQELLKRSVRIEKEKQKMERQNEAQKLNLQLLKERIRKVEEDEMLRRQQENAQLEKLKGTVNSEENTAQETVDENFLKYKFVRPVKTMEDKLTRERQRIGELKALIGCSSSSSDCHFGDYNQSFCVKPEPSSNFNANCNSKLPPKDLPEAGGNCGFKIKEDNLPPFAENEGPMRMLNLLHQFNDYIDKITPEALGLKRFNQTEQTQVCPDHFKLEIESNDSVINRSNGNEKAKENSLNAEDMRAIKKLLKLVTSSAHFNQKKISTACNSPTFEDRRAPVKVSNVFTNLLSKIKSKKPKGKLKPEKIGDTPSNDLPKMVDNSIQQMTKIKNEFRKLRNNDHLKSPNSSGEKRGNYCKPCLGQNGFPSGTHQGPKSSASAAPDWVSKGENVAESAGKMELNNQKLSNEQNLHFRQEHLQETNQILEAELRNLQHHHFEALANKEKAQCELEKQLEDVKSELHEKNEILENARVQFTMQLTTMSEELGMAEDVLKQSLNSGEVLLEDMLKVKEKLTPLFPDIKWYVNEVPKNSLSHLIKISRSYINDLAERLVTTTKELTSNRKETETYKVENAKLSELAEESASKIRSLTEQAKDVENLRAQGEDQTETIERQKAEALAKEELLQKASAAVKQLAGEVLAKDVQIESLKLETQTLREHVDGLSQMILASGTGDAIRELTSAKDELCALQTTHHQVLHERDCALDKLEQYELERAEFEENTNKTNQLLGELEELGRENLEMKEQLATQQSTLAALQNERVRHLEEKNFLNIMFSKLQDEFRKMEQLEGDLFTMNKEANRLALIAEYNKQLGEVLQHEVSERDAVIGELQKNMKSLNDMQQENLQDKVALCQELSAACSMKDVLHSKLDEQIKKTEVQKTAELMTSKDLEAAKETQSKERDVVKEIMTDFDVLVCQRGELLEKQTKATLKNESLRAKNKKLRGKIAKANRLIYEKISVIMQLERDISEKEKEIQQLHLDFQGESAKHAKELGKLKRVTKEKGTLEDSVEYLKKNVQKLQSDLNEAWKNQRESEDLLRLKTKDLERLEALSNEQNFELLRVREERDQLASQVDDLVHQRKNLERQRDMFKGHIRNLEDNAEEQIGELKQELKFKAEKLAALEGNYESIEELYDYLKEDYEEIIVENRNLKQEKLELIAERKTSVGEESDKSEPIRGCDLDMLQMPGDETPVKKSGHINLEEAHKELAQKLLRTAHLLIDEKLGRQEAENKLSDCKRRLSEVEAEKFAEIQKNEAVYEELAKCKGKMDQMTVEGERVTLMLDESKKLSLEIQAKYEDFEAQLTGYKEKYECLKERYNVLASDDNTRNSELLEAKERIDELKTELECKHELVLNLQDEISRLQQDVASIEFERRQINIQLHDTIRELESQQELSRNLELMNKRALSAISDMKDKGILEASECETLLFVVHGSDL